MTTLIANAARKLRDGGPWALLTLALALGAEVAAAQVAGTPGPGNLTIAAGGKIQAVVLASPAPDAANEKLAAEDLAKYIGLMSGAAPRVVSDDAGVAAALKSQSPVFIVGQLALTIKPALVKQLDAVKKKKPVARADAIVVQREANRVYLAGTNDESHYHAVAWLLGQWGCRWYLPTEIGEAIPEHKTLEIGKLDHVYAPPFEIRHYWISWNGSNDGAAEFRLRNYMNSGRIAGMGHALAQYTGKLAPEGKSSFNVPFAEPATAEKVVEILGPQLEKRPPDGISVAIEDGAYVNDSPEDARLKADLQDKYFLKPLMTDPMMAFYSNIGKLLQQKYPDNPTRLGALAYVNVTIPPQWEHEISERLVIWLAPIDIDPIHGIDDENSPPRQEYGAMMYRWAELMNGRVAIYDYDQGMLVWRDLPNPSHTAFAQDAKHYAKAGILGVGTECRNAIATVFTNLYFRGQLMWNPEADVEAMVAEFYPKFYGPAAEPMGRFWDAIYKAWDETVVTEHEYMAAPAIYTPELMAKLARDLAEANSAIAALEAKNPRSRNEELYVQRMQMARLQWDVLEGYMNMVFAAATDVDYTRAASIGREALAARMKLANMNPTFTTRVVGPAPEPVEPGGGPAWFPGEVKQYMDLAAVTDGSQGKLVKKLPLEWAFHRDPHDTGLPRGWGYKPADLSYWEANHQKYDVYSLKDYPTTEWEMIRTDLYPQAQGIRHPDRQSFTGYLWYKTNVDLAAGEVKGDIKIRFPGLFNECWLYVNGFLVAHREMDPMWWYSDYKFEWDVPLAGKLKAGKNDITIRCNNPHHFGGMFRRPFLYTTSK